MGNARFNDAFMRDAMHQITERGYPVAEVSQQVGVSQHSLYEWRKKFSQAATSSVDDGQSASLVWAGRDRDARAGFSPPRQPDIILASL